MFHRHLWLVLLILVLILPRVWSQSVPVLPTVQKPQWTWGIRPLRVGAGVPSALFRTLPVALHDAMKSIPTHTFSLDERRDLRIAALEKALEGERQRLTQLHQARDALLFKSGATEKEQTDASLAIEKALTQIEFYKSLTIQEVSLLDSTTINFKSGPLGILLEDGPESVQTLMAKNTLDFLVSGQLSMLGGYLVVELEGWIPTGTRVFYWKEVMDPKAFNEYIEPGLDRLKEVLLGQPWASLTLSVTPKDADIFVDGDLLGRGIVEFDIFEPGGYTLRVLRPGYKTQFRSFTVARYERARIKVQMEVGESKPQFVLTEPPGANVYLSSIWQGTTPLELKGLWQRELLELRLEGYETMMQPIQPDAPQIQFSLIPVGPKETIQQAKDKFYSSMAYFGVALTSTILLSSTEPYFSRLYLQYGAAYTAGNAAVIDDLNGAFTLQQIAANGGWIGAGIATGFFVYMMVELFNYISVNENQAF